MLTQYSNSNKILYYEVSYPLDFYDLSCLPSSTLIEQAMTAKFVPIQCTHLSLTCAKIGITMHVTRYFCYTYRLDFSSVYLL